MSLPVRYLVLFNYQYTEGKGRKIEAQIFPLMLIFKQLKFSKEHLLIHYQ